MKKIHFIGCAGVSMSALKCLAEKAGFAVTGSDLKLKGHSSKFITPDLDLVVYSSAITKGSEGHKELEAARELKIKTQSRGEYLAELVNSAKDSVVVAGMHGKTTVTTMIGLILKNAGKKPTVIPGTDVKEFGGNYLAGDHNFVVTEGCEYFDNFLHLKPKIGVITNIEEEHLDYFSNIKSIIKSFAKFISNIDPDGALIYFSGDENISKAIKQADRTPKNMIPYGVIGEGENVKLDFPLRVPGQHNKLNAMAALTVAGILNVDNNVSKETLASYSGAGRRMEIKGEINGVLVIDDYGHHPTEIRNTICALKEAYPKKRLIVAFWPHQYKRIEALLNDFIQSFKEADEVVLLPIYFVPGRDEIRPVNSEKIALGINNLGKKAKVYSDQEELVKYLQQNLKSNDLLLTIGIPPIYQVAEKFLKGD